MGIRRVTYVCVVALIYHAMGSVSAIKRAKQQEQQKTLLRSIAVPTGQLELDPTPTPNECFEHGRDDTPDELPHDVTCFPYKTRGWIPCPSRTTAPDKCSAYCKKVDVTIHTGGPPPSYNCPPTLVVHGIWFGKHLTCDSELLDGLKRNVMGNDVGNVLFKVWMTPKYTIGLEGSTNNMDDQMAAFLKAKRCIESINTLGFPVVVEDATPVIRRQDFEEIFDGLWDMFRSQTGKREYFYFGAMSDMLRVLILIEEGGLYADLTDTNFAGFGGKKKLGEHASFAEAWSDLGVSEIGVRFALNHGVNAAMNGGRPMNHALYAARSGHPFMRRFAELVKETMTQKVRDKTFHSGEVLMSTGIKKQSDVMRSMKVDVEGPYEGMSYYEAFMLGMCDLRMAHPESRSWLTQRSSKLTYTRGFKTWLEENNDESTASRLCKDLDGLRRSDPIKFNHALAPYEHQCMGRPDMFGASSDRTWEQESQSPRSQSGDEPTKEQEGGDGAF